MPDVSVIIPARNAGATIADSLRSVLAQENLAEIIVVDDGSTDDTAKIVAAFDDPRIHVLSGPGTGISDALNAGLFAASAEFVARCDADDYFLPGRLKAQADWFAGNSGYVAVSGGFISTDQKGRKLAELACDGEDRDITDALQHGKAFSHLGGWLIRRKTLLSTGGARAWFQTAEDVDLQMRLSFTGRVWHQVRPVYGYRLHETSVTHSRKTAQLRFFDHAVQDFAAERRARGTDSLDEGHPPALPDFSRNAGQPNKVSRQVVGHLTSQAWSEFKAGRKAAGIRLILRALGHDPLNFQCWKSLALMSLRSLRVRPR